MKKTLFYSILIAITISSGNAQTISLNPSKDAIIKAVNGQGNNQNYGDFIFLNMHAWSNSGDFVVHRSLIDFDLSQIPQGSLINKADLYLFADPNCSSNHTTYDGHAPLSQTNKSIIQRLTSNWAEYSVTWNTQPSVTTANEEILPESNHKYEDYIVDVTNLVQDMVNDPQNSYGFRIKILNEVEYCRMIFASSDHPNTELSPFLSVQYDTTQTNTEYYKTKDLDISIYPNPTHDVVTIKADDLTKDGILHAEIYNIQGQLIKQVELTDQKTSFNTKALQRGVYFLKITRDNEILKVEQLIIQKSGFT